MVYRIFLFPVVFFHFSNALFVIPDTSLRSSSLPVHCPSEALIKFEITQSFPAQILLCPTPLSHGMVGFVFPGILFCPPSSLLSGCARFYRTTAVPAAAAWAPEIHRQSSFARVAVKFNRKPDKDGRVTSGKKTLRSDIRSEISHLDKLQVTSGRSPYVRILGIISDPQNFYQPHQLEGPGLVMEYLDGKTARKQVAEDFTTIIESEKRSERFSCYLMQFLKAHEFELKKGIFNKDLHWSNAIVSPNDFFRLRDEITCGRIKFIDVGIIHENVHPALAVRELIRLSFRYIGSTSDLGKLLNNVTIDTTVLHYLARLIHQQHNPAEILRGFTAAIKKFRSALAISDSPLREHFAQLCGLLGHSFCSKLNSVA
jgi:hypothetical protein